MISPTGLLIIKCAAVFGVVSNVLLATMLFPRLLRPLLVAAQDYAKSAGLPGTRILKAERTQRAMLLLSALGCAGILWASFSPSRMEALLALLALN